MANVDMEWRQGPTGMGDVYVFNPKPSITNANTGQKLVEFKVPLRFGSIVQQLGKDSQRIRLNGILNNMNGNYDDFVEMKQELEAGLDVLQEGQLHIISNFGNMNSQHIYYNGIPVNITFAEQTHPHHKFVEYQIEILLADPTENIV